MGNFMRSPAHILPLTALAMVLGSAPAWAQTVPVKAPKGIEKIEHIVVIYLENHSFDNLFGKFPSANGLTHAGKAAIQVDKDGKPYKALPPVVNPFPQPTPDARFPSNLPNRPFLIDQYVPLDQKYPSAIHAYYHQIAQNDG